MHFNRDYNITLSEQINQFSSSHILSDLFVITISSKLATINGKRIGERISDEKDIRDNETNSGLGYIMLLTSILSCIFGFISLKYELIVGINYSVINVIGSDMVIPSGVKTYEKFNEAAKAYLEYFAEFYIYLTTTKQISSIKNDYEFIIDKDCINGESITLDINKLHAWTQCMKSLLTELKYLITQVIINEDNQYKHMIDEKNESDYLNDSILLSKK